ncbi:EAL domain-containing protein [Marinomonas sp. A79]|uniref:EAL domain-containing protein n=1 Tax=Marinomonas vulgaris TaxID=2823372 RepID=A0ABS5HDS2_9GAMM|nr:EAL domain-containing protein [Marinomonas vulgaris]MBR7889801.1 EAL domain-containing protein [Marinomonas vulgaris]
MHLIGLLFYIGIPIFAYYVESARDFIITSFNLSPEITVLIGIAYLYPLSVFLMSVVFKNKGFANITYFRSQVTLSSTLSVSFGLIGTFIGLSQMIAGIAAGMGADGDFTSKMASLLGAISTALDSMSLAFLTSILGVGASVAILFSSNYLASFYRENDDLKQNEGSGSGPGVNADFEADDKQQESLNNIKQYLEQTFELTSDKEKVWSDLYLMLEKNSGSELANTLSDNIQTNSQAMTAVKDEIGHLRTDQRAHQEVTEQVFTNTVQQMQQEFDGLRTDQRAHQAATETVFDKMAQQMKDEFTELKDSQQTHLRTTETIFGQMADQIANHTQSNNATMSEMRNAMIMMAETTQCGHEALSQTIADTSHQLSSVASILHDLRIQMAIPLEESLANALRENGLDLVYQVQADGEGKVMGAEVYVRWNEPVRGLVPSSVLFDVAEKHDMLVQVDRWVIKAAVEQVSVWNKQGVWQTGQTMSINISHKTLVDPGLLNYIEILLEDHDLEASCFAFEVTENTIMNYPEEARDKVRQISRLGIKVFIDDFGTGYSSLVNLKNFKIDRLKIDKGIVQDVLEYSDQKESIIRSIMNIAGELDIQVSAEGIETQEQLDLLSSVGCSMFQGYFLGRPQTAEDFEASSLVYTEATNA